LSNVHAHTSHPYWFQLSDTNCLDYLNLAYRYNLRGLQVAAVESFFARKQHVIQLHVTQPRDVEEYESIPLDVLEAMGLLHCDSDD
jgi:hypothetical protein